MNTKIIGFTGFKQSGKTTVAGLLGPPVVSFADKVREVAKVSFGFDRSDMCVAELKEKENAFWDITPREALQRIGMMYREKFGKDFWIRCLEKRIRQKDWDIVCIDDCRFLNEAEWIREHGVVVGINRPGVELDDGHASEVQMEKHWDEMTDYEVLNDREPRDAANAVLNIMLDEFGTEIAEKMEVEQ